MCALIGVLKSAGMCVSAVVLEVDEMFVSAGACGCSGRVVVVGGEVVVGDVVDVWVRMCA